MNLFNLSYDKLWLNFKKYSLEILDKKIKNEELLFSDMIILSV